MKACFRWMITISPSLLAYSYEFTNDGRKLKVKLRENVTFHNGRTLTSADVIATLDFMFELTGFDDELNSDVPTADRGLYYSTFYSIKSWEATDDYNLVFTLLIAVVLIRAGTRGHIVAHSMPLTRRRSMSP